MMRCFSTTLVVETMPRSMLDVTGQVEAVLRNAGLQTGLVHVFCRHTSCSLIIMENADPSARHDLQSFLDRLVPEGDARYTHRLEGPDDMPSHIKMALTRTSETIPFAGGCLSLGTWQGLFLWEHRASFHRRELVITIQGV